MNFTQKTILAVLFAAVFALSPSPIVTAFAPSSLARQVVHEGGVETLSLDYDQVQQIIDVSRPYYKLENERQVTVPLSDDQTAENMHSKTPMQNGFLCTVDPDMAVGREAGTISSAEAGRHMAIAGSVAAALNQPKTKSGKHYYLAFEFELKTLSTPPSQHFDVMKKLKNDGTDVTILALCTDLNKRKAVCEIVMQFPKERGGEVWHICVTYDIIPEKVFKRFILVDAPEVAKAALTKHISNGTNHEKKYGNISPYAQFQGISSDSFEILHSGTSSTVVKSSVPTITPEKCLGHFDGIPALPVAFLSSYCGDVAGKLVSIASGGKYIPFKKDRFSLMNEIDGDDIYALKFISLGGEVNNLVFAGTHGIDIFCEVEKEVDSIFTLNVTVVPSNVEQSDPIGHWKYCYEIVKPRTRIPPVFNK